MSPARFLLLANVGTIDHSLVICNSIHMAFCFFENFDQIRER